MGSIRERTQYTDEIDFKDIADGKSILVDTKPDIDNLDMNNVPEIVHAAITAVKGMDIIPDARFSAHVSEDGVYTIEKDVSSFVSSEHEMGIPSMGLKIHGASSHDTSLSIRIAPDGDDGYDVDVSAYHGGDFGEKLDASEVQLRYKVNADGDFVKRDGSAHTDEYGVSLRDQAHGNWAIDAAQTLENKFANVLGGQAKEFIDANRPEGSATEVGKAPEDENSVKMSTINFDALKNDAPEAPAADVKPDVVQP